MGDNKPRTKGSRPLSEDAPERLKTFHHREEQQKNSWENLRMSGRKRSKSSPIYDLDDAPRLPDNVQNSLPRRLIDRSNMGGTKSGIKESRSVTGGSCLSSPEESLEPLRNREEQDRDSDSPRRRLTSREQRFLLENSGESEKKKELWYQMSAKTMLWLIVGVLVLLSIILAVLLATTCRCAVTDPRSVGPPCEKSWIWVDGRCYYFSDIKKNWKESRDFCTRHGSTLAVLMDQEIKKTIERYGENLDYWIGLSMNHNGRWMWTNGSPYNGSVDNQDSRHLRCAFLNSHLGALHCSTLRQWICVQDST